MHVNKTRLYGCPRAFSAIFCSRFKLKLFISKYVRHVFFVFVWTFPSQTTYYDVWTLWRNKPCDLYTRQTSTSSTTWLPLRRKEKRCDSTQFLQQGVANYCLRDWRPCLTSWVYTGGRRSLLSFIGCQLQQIHSLEGVGKPSLLAHGLIHSFWPFSWLLPSLVE